MNPFLGTFLGWCLSFLYGRVSKSEVQGVTVWMVKRTIPKWSDAQTYGHIILTKLADGDLIMHELRHVEQWRRLGFWGLGFICAYLYEWLKHGYYNNALEREARGE